ncbi:cell division protein CrgA [Nesterenkonia lutea]|uniref:Uncharacterized protein n=1 Tax=Nesterenkonia lutea TaxID=272919 RepID=A0ABR9JAV8_9MICC|nr:hypothetical protein [Nesterenkonia lutea]MBE1522915.1 hypothetical protein [Nesterenkonia lutea]
MSTSTSTALHGETRHAGSRPGRVLLWSGVVVAALSGVSLLMILVMYFLQTDPHPAIYAAGLWGLPLGFGLMTVYLLFSAGHRRRRGVGLG